MKKIKLKQIAVLFLMLNMLGVTAEASDLHSAARSGNLLNVTIALNSGAKIDEIGGFFDATPLFIASAAGHLDVMKFLIVQGADVNKKSEFGETPLFVAAINKRSKAIELLLKHKADPTILNKQNVSPLVMAAGNGDLDSVKVILNHSHFSASKALLSAASSNSIAVASLLLSQDIDPNVIEDKYAAIHYAAMDHAPEVLKLLIEHKADINLPSSKGTTAIFLALQRSDAEIIEMLLSAGVDANTANPKGEAIILKAAINRKTGPLKALIKHHANLEARDRMGRTALMLALKRGKIDNAKLLIASGADVKAVSKKGKDMMYFASNAKSKSDQAIMLLK